MSTENSHNKPTTLSVADRLPCRGCARNCQNYTFCGGKPWRAENITVAQAKKVLTNV